MENNISKKIKIIHSKIKNINNQYSDFFASLDELEIPSRDALIEDIYHEILLKNELLTEIKHLNIKTIITLEKEQIFEQILSQIKSNPNKKDNYIKEFLDLFEDISPQDKKVMLVSFLKLSEQELKEQMANLLTLFKFKT